MPDEIPEKFTVIFKERPKTEEYLHKFISTPNTTPNPFLKNIRDSWLEPMTTNSGRNI